VRSACEGPQEMHAETGREDDAASYLGAGLTELARDDTVAARGARRAAKRLDAPETEGDGLPDLSVMASGNLGLISFPREPGRVTLERLDQLHPRLLPALRDHPGIAFVMVRSERDGTLAIGRGGVHHLASGHVEGDDPLAPFGPTAIRHLRRTDSFPHCPDVMVNSTYWDETGEVAAFEELVGSHGGMGGTQSHPFVLHPADLPWPDAPVVGAEHVHRIMSSWLGALGHESYLTPADEASGSPRSETRSSPDRSAR